MFSYPDTVKDKRTINHFKKINSIYVSEPNKKKFVNNHELSKIASKYKHATDKCNDSTYWRKHSYTEFYGPFLQQYKNKPINLLEIGIRWGGSILMWLDYFPNAQIYCIDKTLKNLKVDINHPRIHVYEGNAYDINTVNKYFGNIKFDVILDDGSHIPEHQIFVLNHYSKLMKPNSILMIEDFITDKAIQDVINGFNGKRNRLSVINRTHCVPSGAGEVIILYYN